MEGAGARLRTIRLERGISLEDASKKTKVHLNILKSIEDGSFDQMQINPVYLKGFIKIYCKFLDLDPKEYVIEQREPEQKVVPAGPAGRPKEAAPLGASGMAREGKPFKVSNPYNPQRMRKVLRIAITAVLFVVAGVILFYIGMNFILWAKSILRKISASKPAVTRSVPVKAPKAVKAAAKQSKPALPAQAAALPNVAAGPQTKTLTGLRFGLRAKEDCWLHLKVDGQLVFQGVLKKGRFESWQAKERVEFSLGNATAVDLEVNGKLIPPIGRNKQQIRNAVITREGLSLP
jgi:cytoskeleton protein RodZ